MSVILGLNCNHADSSACIVKNGKLIIALEEERINRVKLLGRTSHQLNQRMFKKF